MKGVKKGNFIHDNKKNATDVWVTPPWVFEGLGLEFDLDPATEQGGIPWIPATNIFTKEDNGLIQDWSEYGLIWCNPPYGNETGKFLKKNECSQERRCFNFCAN